jgi:hypothetical protein
MLAISLGLRRGEKMSSTNTEYMSNPKAKIDKKIRRRFSIVIKLKRIGVIK